MNNFLVEAVDSKTAKKMLKADKLDDRRLCSGLNKFYCEGVDCENVYTVTDIQIGEKSINGVVYQTCLQSNCDYIAKWQKNTEVALTEANIQQYAAKNGLAPYIRQVLTCEEGAIIIMDSLTIAVSRLIKSLKPQQLKATLENNLDIFDRAIKTNGLNINYKKDEIKNIEDLATLRSRINSELYSNGYNPISDIITVEDDEKQSEFRKNIVLQVYALLNKLHSLGIVHDDAHLNNFMADKNMVVKIIDFGTAKYSNDVEKDFKRAVRDISRYISEGYTNLEYLEDYARTLK